MRRANLPQRVREAVAQRARFCCEYCLIHEADSFFEHEVDHIVSRKHGGNDDPDNLAYACVACNRYKGSDVGSLTAGNRFVRFFNPRLDEWRAHFNLMGPEIVPLTEVAEVTARIFRFNDEARVLEQAALQDWGRYPMG